MNEQDQYMIEAASAIECMHAIRNPSRKLQDLLDSSRAYPKYICASKHRDDAHCPLALIFEHNVRVPAAEGDEKRIRVVCKISNTTAGNSWLVDEAAFYECPRVAPLLGREIPKFFGLFQTPAESADEAITRAKALCLVLEYGGKHLPPTHEEGFRDQTLRFQ